MSNGVQKMHSATQRYHTVKGLRKKFNEISRIYCAILKPLPRKIKGFRRIIVGTGCALLRGMAQHTNNGRNTMTNAIKHLIEKASSNFGGSEDIALIENAFHACNPSIANGWTARAVRLDGEWLEIGKVHWDFKVECDDAADYDWDFSAQDFDVENTLDLTDEDEKEEAIDIFN